ELDGSALVDQLAWRIGKRLGTLERRDRLVVEEIHPARLLDDDVGQAAVGLELNPEHRDAIPHTVDVAGRIATAILEIGSPVLGHAALDAVEERRKLPLLGVERRLVPFVDVLEIVVGAAATPRDRAHELLV